MPSSRSVYRTRLLHGSALLPQMRTLVRFWSDDAKPVDVMPLIEQRRLLGGVSSGRIKDIIYRIFIPRYVRGNPPNAWRLLRLFEEADASLPLVRPLYYFYAARSETVLGDFVRQMLYPYYIDGRIHVNVKDALRFLTEAEADGRIPTPWSEQARLHVARNLLAALRDFGILEGRVRKRFTSPHLPLLPFAHIAFLLTQERQGAAALAHPDWRLFLLSHDAIERLFLEADRDNLLRYNAAGSIVRIDFPEEDLDAYSRFLVARAY